MPVTVRRARPSSPVTWLADRPDPGRRDRREVGEQQLAVRRRRRCRRRERAPDGVRGGAASPATRAPGRAPRSAKARSQSAMPCSRRARAPGGRGAAPAQPGRARRRPGSKPFAAGQVSRVADLLPVVAGGVRHVQHPVVLADAAVLGLHQRPDAVEQVGRQPPLVPEVTRGVARGGDGRVPGASGGAPSEVMSVSQPSVSRWAVDAGRRGHGSAGSAAAARGRGGRARRCRAHRRHADTRRRRPGVRRRSAARAISRACGSRSERYQR